MAVFLAGCEPAPSPREEGKPLVFASIAPLAGLASRLGGDRVQVEVLAGPEADPHGFSPTPKQLVDLAGSSLFLTIGMPFERRLVEKVESTTKGFRVVNVAEGMELLDLDEHHHHGEQEEEKKEKPAEEPDHHHHEEETSDTHVWLSPTLLKKQAAVIAHALEEIDPEGHEVYHANLDALLADLEALQNELGEALAPYRGQAFYVFHGAFAYFARDFGLTQEAIETGGRSPEPKRIIDLIERAKADGVKLILVQPQFDTKSAEAIAEGIGGTVAPVNPMGTDVFETLRTLARQIRASRQAE